MRLLNLGFQKKSEDTYVCEDITVKVLDNGKYLIVHLNMEVTIDELEELMLAD